MRRRTLRCGTVAVAVLPLAGLGSLLARRTARAASCTATERHRASSLRIQLRTGLLRRRHRQV